jgi:hypothetical protein
LGKQTSCYSRGKRLALIPIDVNQLIQNTEIDRLAVSSESRTLKKHSESEFYLTKFNIHFTLFACSLNKQKDNTPHVEM